MDSTSTKPKLKPKLKEHNRPDDVFRSELGVSRYISSKAKPQLAGRIAQVAFQSRKTNRLIVQECPVLWVSNKDVDPATKDTKSQYQFNSTQYITTLCKLVLVYAHKEETPSILLELKLYDLNQKEADVVLDRVLVPDARHRVSFMTFRSHARFRVIQYPKDPTRVSGNGDCGQLGPYVSV